MTAGDEIMQCRDLRPLLSGYVDQELSPDELVLVEGHLAGCARCRSLVARHAAVAQAISRLPAPRVPDGFASRVLAHPTLVHARLLRRPSWTPTWEREGRPVRYRRRPTWLLPAAAAFLFVILLGWGYLDPHGAPPLATAASDLVRRFVATVAGLLSR